MLLIEMFVDKNQKDNNKIKLSVDVVAEERKKKKFSLKTKQLNSAVCSSKWTSSNRRIYIARLLKNQAFY